jgi:hypothetical protein
MLFPLVIFLICFFSFFLLLTSFLLQMLISLSELGVTSSILLFPSEEKLHVHFYISNPICRYFKIKAKAFISKYYQINPIKLALLHNSLLLPSLTPVWGGGGRVNCIPRTSPPSDRYSRQM